MLNQGSIRFADPRPCNVLSPSERIQSENTNDVMIFKQRIQCYYFSWLQLYVPQKKTIEEQVYHLI